MAVEREVLQFDSAEAWQRWLETHAATSTGVQLRIAKKGSAHVTVSHGDALDEALCHGWIDAVRNRLDDDFFLQTFMPRTKTSSWSQVNQEKVAALTAEGRMRERGQAEIDRARADGRWDAAYAPQRANVVPDDIVAALATASDTAKATWEKAGRQARFVFILNTNAAKRPETRVRRIATLLEKLERGDAF